MITTVKDQQSKHFSQLDSESQEVVEQALVASGSAYAPYSEFVVGAAIQTVAGVIYQGTNFENASLGLSICAEVSALAAFHLSGTDSPINMIAVVGYRFGKTLESESIVTPCGRCRQLILEVAQVTQKDIEILSCNGSLTKIQSEKISDLIPWGFGPQNFRDRIDWSQLRSKLRESVGSLVERIPSLKMGR